MLLRSLAALLCWSAFRILREQHAIDLAIMNAENLAGGFSVTPSLCEQLFTSGIDVMTSGNHIFDKKEAIPYIVKQPRLIRPANYPPNTPGSGMWTGMVNGTQGSGNEFDGPGVYAAVG